MNKGEVYNILVTGVGGQGILTLSKILIKAALIEGYDVKSSELHGLAQRGGHIECHVRLGRRVYSSLIEEGNADLILGLEPLETLRAAKYGSKQKTKILTNTHRLTPLSVSFNKDVEYPSLDKIEENLKLFSLNMDKINATELVENKVGSTTPTNVFLLAKAIKKDLIPLKKENILESIRSILPEKYIEMNEKVFEMAFSK